MDRTKKAAPGANGSGQMIGGDPLQVSATAGQLHRRQDCARRLVALPCGHRDPAVCGPNRIEVAGAVAAHDHLRSLGLVPLWPRDELRDLWARGHRSLARHLAEGWTA